MEVSGFPQVGAGDSSNVRTGHLNAPSEPINFSPMVEQETAVATYWRPTKLKVRRAMRIDSVEPFIEGVPLHDAA